MKVLIERAILQLFQHFKSLRKEYIMRLHELIVKEFERTKSLSALIYLIEHGREIEFLFEGRRYFLSRSNSKKRVSLWSNQGQEEQSFDDIEELIEKATMLNDLALLDALPQIQLETIF